MKPFSRHQHHHLRSLGLRLSLLLQDLERLTATERLTPLAPAFAGPAVRLVAEARTFLKLPPLPLPTTRLAPGEIFAEALLILGTLTDLKAQQTQATPAVHQKSYPRRSGRV